MSWSLCSPGHSSHPHKIPGTPWHGGPRGQGDGSIPHGEMKPRPLWGCFCSGPGHDVLGRASVTASVLGFSIGPAAYRAKTSVALSPPPTCCLLWPHGISEFLDDAPQCWPPLSVCSNAQLIAPSQALVHTRPINQNPITVVRKLEANLISSGHSPMLFLCSSLPSNENCFHGLHSPASSSEAPEDGRRGGRGLLPCPLSLSAQKTDGAK